MGAYHFKWGGTLMPYISPSHPIKKPESPDDTNFYVYSIFRKIIFVGCQPCQCNEHEDITKGICDKESGVCYCADNTEGDQCQKCKSGFFGNSLEGGQCHYNCGSR